MTEAEEEKMETENEGEKQNISVKGVRKDIYTKVLKLTRDTGQTLGEITNEAYRTFLSGIDGAKHLSKNFIEGATKSQVKYVENIKSLTLEKNDLKEFPGKIAFRNMDLLVLSDLTTEDVENHIATISNVKVVKIPGTVSKASILLRSSFVDEIRSLE